MAHAALSHSSSGSNEVDKLKNGPCAGVALRFQPQYTPS